MLGFLKACFSSVKLNYNKSIIRITAVLREERMLRESKSVNMSSTGDMIFKISLSKGLNGPYRDGRTIKY